MYYDRLHIRSPPIMYFSTEIRMDVVQNSVQGGGSNL